MVERWLWNEKVEMMSSDEIIEIQTKKLRKQIKYCYETSPLYYKKKFDEIGAKPDDIKTFEDFRKLPIMLTKDDERQSQQESLERFGHPFGLHLCAPLEKIVGVSSTSGTTGNPVFYAFTERDIRATNEALARGYWRAGIRPGDTVLHAFGLSMWVAGIPIVRALTAMGTRPVPVGAEAGTERLLLMARLTKPSAMVCTPSLAEHLIVKAEAILGRGGPAELGIRRIVCAGEPGAGLTEVKERIEKAFGAKLYDSAGVPWGLWNVSCDAEEYQGMHIVSEDFCIWYDIVDPDTKEPLEIKDGAIGEGLITALQQEGIPPLKYKLGDIVQIFTEPCVCGMPGKRLKVLGRADDMLIVKGINVYPAAIKNVLTSFMPRVTGHMRIVLEKPGPRVDPPLRLKVEYGAGMDESAIEGLKREMGQKMSEVLRVRPEIEFLAPNTLERDPTKKGKLIERLYEKPGS